ncbi:concanavalin A-like lectin/glucanase domain-containing protein [Dendryphion nanum]|uniref:Concanavalin A-like lectin/glucanase domain-containing protein n=1 Tax=Dendryphion nanum TaxID=256645 RepID=A0A9P9DXT6_9PLEO|nr:concanavalin A-like lectin/glucanase domain-containing protein [Dendryphion nanum]
MKLSTLLSLAGTASIAVAAPAPIERRADMCGQWDSTVSGVYTLYNNLWGRDDATSGSQCTTLDSVSGSTIKWHAKWTWVGGPGHVKSYPNVVTKFTQKALSAVSSLKSEWAWTYTGNGVIANVAYDLFTSSQANGNPENEIMIWLSALGGAGPISSTGAPIATVTLAGKSWKLYKGMNRQMVVYSFVASSAVKSFNGDVNEFVKYLTSKQGLNAAQILTSIGAGTEPFEGSNAVFTTTKYTLSVK